MQNLRSGMRWSVRGLLLLAVFVSGCGADFGTGVTVRPIEIMRSEDAATWSPDGLRIAYMHYQKPSIQGIWIVDTTGAGAHPILNGAWASPDWAPDGVHLAVCRNGIYSVRSNGDSLRQITTQGLAPHWSPDGTELVYYTQDTLGIGTIWLVQRDGTGLRSLAPPPNQSWTEPDWSPDGTRLIHLRRVLPGGPPQVFVMDTTGHAEQQLTTDTSEKYSPEWSPDGRWIAWSTYFRVWIMKSDGTEAHDFVNGSDPSWSPDSRRIVYSFIAFETGYLLAIDIETLRGSGITRASGVDPGGNAIRQVARAAPAPRAQLTGTSVRAAP